MMSNIKAEQESEGGEHAEEESPCNNRLLHTANSQPQEKPFPVRSVPETAAQSVRIFPLQRGEGNIVHVRHQEPLLRWEKALLVAGWEALDSAGEPLLNRRASSDRSGRRLPRRLQWPSKGCERWIPSFPVQTPSTHRLSEVPLDARRSF